jgi:hypothetical protein
MSWLILLGLAGATAALAIYRPTRAFFGAALDAVSSALETASAFVVRWVFDPLIPIDEFSRRAPRARMIIWGMINVLCAVVWTAVSIGPLGLYAKIAVGVSALLGLANLLLLTGAYFALREGISIMNFDRKFTERKFRRSRDDRPDWPTAATHPGVVSLAAACIILHASIGVHALDRILDGVVLQGAETDSFASALLATCGVLPLASLYFAFAGLTEKYAFAPGMGFWVGQFINTGGSIVVVATLFSFVEQHQSLKTLTENLMTEKSPQTLDRLEERMKQAPSLIKRYMSRAFFDGDDDEMRLRMIGYLTNSRRSYRFPAAFIRHYAALTPRLKEEGSAIVAAGLERRKEFEANVLIEVVESTALSFNRAGKSAADRKRIGAIVLPCVERLLKLDPAGNRKFARQKPVQDLLFAFIAGTSGNVVQERALAIVLAARRKDSIVRLIRALKHLSPGQQIAAIGTCDDYIRSGTHAYDNAAGNSELRDIVRAIDWNIHNMKFEPHCRSALGQLRALIVQLQRGTKPSAPPAAGGQQI